MISGRYHWLTNLIIGSIDENFVYDLEKARHVFDFSMDHPFGIRIVGPKSLRDSLNASNVWIRSFKNMLQLCELNSSHYRSQVDQTGVRTFVYVSDAVLLFPGGFGVLDCCSGLVIIVIRGRCTYLLNNGGVSIRFWTRDIKVEVLPFRGAHIASSL